MHLETRPQKAVQFRLYDHDNALVERYAEQTGKTVASAVRAIVLQHIGQELGTSVDVAAYDNSASVHAEMATKLGMSLAQFQAVAMRTLTQTLQASGGELPQLLRQAPVAPGAPQSAPLPPATRQRRRRAK